MGKETSTFSNKNKSSGSWITLVLVVMPLATVSFYPSINGTFVFDDTEAIVRNGDVRLPNKSLSQIFLNDFWGKPLTSNRSHKSYRPLTVLTFRWNYMDKLDPKPFHILNVLLHAAACFLLWFVYGEILSADSKRHTNGWLSKRTFATLLFATHPIHTENVAGIVGRADVLAAICFFGSFLLHARVTSFGRTETRSRVGAVTLTVCSYILAFVSMLFKENGITVLGLCFAYDVVHSWPFASPDKTNRLLFARISGLLITGVCALTFRWWVMGGTLPTFLPLDNPASFANSVLQRAANYNYVYAIDAWILLCPIWLCFDWSMGCIPLIEHFTDIRLLAVVFLWIILFNLLIVNLTWSLNRQLTMAMMLSLLPFVPASNLLVTVGFVVAERVLYLTSAGFCLIVALGFDLLKQRFRHLHLLDWLGVLLLTVFVARCWQRSKDWCTEERLFTSGVSVCPLNAKIHYNIAKNAADNGRTDLAIAKYREALKLFPNYYQAMNNLANLLKDHGDLYEAEKLLLRTVEIRPDFAAAWMNLGIVQAFLKKPVQAERSYLTALIHRANYPDCYYNLGNLFLDLKLYDQAYNAWRNATILKPTHVGSWNNMVIMFDNIGDLDRARSLGQDAVKVLPNEAFAYFNLANVFGKLGDYVNSEINFLKAIQLNGSNPTYFTNLGVLYHRWKRYTDAINAYENALRINPNAKSAKENLLRLVPEKQNGHLI